MRPFLKLGELMRDHTDTRTVRSSVPLNREVDDVYGRQTELAIDGTGPNGKKLEAVLDYPGAMPTK